MIDKRSAGFYLRDTGVLLKELALKARAERDAARHGEEQAYAEGRLMGFHESISLMQQQADAFSIERAEIGLDDIEPERDLV